MESGEISNPMVVGGEFVSPMSKRSKIFLSC